MNNVSVYIGFLSSRKL